MCQRNGFTLTTNIYVEAWNGRHRALFTGTNIHFTLEWMIHHSVRVLHVYKVWDKKKKNFVPRGDVTYKLKCSRTIIKKEEKKGRCYLKYIWHTQREWICNERRQKGTKRKKKEPKVSLRAQTRNTKDKKSKKKFNAHIIIIRSVCT